MTRIGDPLARVTTEVGDLLARIDHALVHYGVCTAYPEHLRVLDGLRDFAALPGTVFDHIRDVDPVALAGSMGISDPAGGTGPVAGLGGSWHDLAGRLGTVVSGLYWGGPAREAFDGYWAPLAGYLDGGTAGRMSMVEAATATAGYGDGIVAWWRDVRAAVVAFFGATLENGIAVALGGVDVSAPLDIGTAEVELPEIEGFERVSLAATRGADLFLGAVGAAVRREPAGGPPPGELPYRSGSRPAVTVAGRSWVRVGEQDTVDG